MSAPSFRRFNPDAYLQTLGSEAAKAAKVAKVDPAPASEGKTLAGLATLAGPLAWDAADWREYFEERAAVAEHDGGLSRADAERQAYECSLSEWLQQHPPPASGPAWCVHCGEPLGEPGQDGLPYLTGNGGHVWLHCGCHGDWSAQRRAEAVAALAGIGMTLPESTESLSAAPR